jgi:hypothetical protein
LNVIALIHGSPGEISVKKSELDSELREKLERFKEKVKTGRLVQFWNTSADLTGLVALNLLNAIRTYPAVSWVRADKVANVEVLTEINELRKQNTELQSKLARLQPAPAIEGLAGLDEEFIVSGKQLSGRLSYDWKVNTTWRKIFPAISPYLVEVPPVKNRLESALGGDVTIDDQVFKTIGLQLKALRLVNIDYQSAMVGLGTVYWSVADPYRGTPDDANSDRSHESNGRKSIGKVLRTRCPRAVNSGIHPQSFLNIITTSTTIPKHPAINIDTSGDVPTELDRA